VTPILVQDSAGSILLYLETTAGVPATGLVDTDVTAALKKATDSAFVAFTLTGVNFTELGAGFYEVLLADTDTSVLGNLYLRISGGTIKTALEVAFVLAIVPATPPVVTPPATVAIFGYLYGPDAVPEPGVSVTARILGAPTLLHPGTSGILVSQGLVSATTDSDGFFTLQLISGSTVDIFISAANYRRTLLVPSTSANLFDIP